jgi:hypothetical protein
MKKNRILIITIFLIGIIFRIYPAFKQPLWLDEVYSLYFAHSYFVGNLLINLPETHPGGFYLLLKFFLNFTTNIFFLRLILGVLPELIACWLLYKTHPKIGLIILFLFNPFFIHYSWQLRMYSFAFLFTVLLYKNFFVHIPKFDFWTTVLILLSLLFSFDLIIPILCLTFYAFVKTRQKSWLLFFIFVPLTFLILKGPTTYKTYTELASWISPPTFTNLPSFLLTSLGFRNDINNLSPLSPLLSFIFYLPFLIIVYYSSKKSSLFFYGFTLPTSIIIIVSVLFPFLSQHFFFFQFIPKISLILPRFILPLSIFFFLGLYQSLSNKIIFLLLIPLFIIFWIKPNLKLNYFPYYDPVLPFTTPINSLVLPPWENLRLKPNFSKNDLDLISQKYNSSLITEKYVVNFESHPDCLPLQQFSQIIYLDQSIPNLNNYQQHTKKILSWCSKSP